MSAEIRQSYEQNAAMTRFSVLSKQDFTFSNLFTSKCNLNMYRKQTLLLNKFAKAYSSRKDIRKVFIPPYSKLRPREYSNIETGHKPKVHIFYIYAAHFLVCRTLLETFKHLKHKTKVGTFPVSYLSYVGRFFLLLPVNYLSYVDGALQSVILVM
jgi:hypothetical protein